jgi:hypothetical protein
MSNKIQNLDSGGCCDGISYLTPASVENVPGLSSLVYRVGTHGRFKTSMQTGIASKPALDKLTSREDDDASIALLDGWATVLDILTFYQERIADEGFLRTAKERRSVLELARHISYTLSPGVAAGTFLAFTMDEAVGAPTKAVIPVGTKTQSVPAQRELPQVFQTSEEILARKEYNAIRPRLSQPQTISTSMQSIMLSGTNLNIKKGDIVMIKNGSSKKAKKVMEITLDQKLNTTRIDFDVPELSPHSYLEPSIADGKLDDLKNYKTLNSDAIDLILARKWKEEVLASLLKIKKWDVDDLVEGIIREKTENLPVDLNKGVYIFRQTASVFGYNATKQVTYDANRYPNPQHLWAEWDLVENDGKVYLENANDKILSNSFAIIKTQDESIENAIVYQITDVNVGSRTEYGISSKTTRLTVSPAYHWDLVNDDLAVIRSLIVHTQTENLALTEVTIDDVIEGNTIILNGSYPEIFSGQKMIITGELSNLHGIFSSEMRTIDEVVLEGGFTVVTFLNTLDNVYIRNTVTINANVVAANHGETKRESLGSGDGSKVFQEFKLKQIPLTYTSASSASGRETTLEIRVNNILWEEVPTLFDTSPDDKIYVTRIADDGTITIQFGDGKTGSRLPTGMENVRATYRVGTGLAGLLKEGQLSQLMTPQLGVRGVSNPLATTGGENPEKLENARHNAPLTVLTLDRIVSLQDYEDFALAFAGIGKARADLMWDGEQQVVYITIASASGDTVDESSDLFKNLSTAIDKARHSNHKVIIESFNPLFFDIKAKVLIDSNYLTNKVIDEIEAVLENAFSFELRDFGQSATPSEITAKIQGVDGVIAVDLDTLNGLDPFAKEHFRLQSKFARWENDEILPAQLLTINPNGIEINEMSS